MVGASCCGNRPSGPFVPAPPEMTMQFLRECPAPFHPGAFIGGSDGNGNGMAWHGTGSQKTANWRPNDGWGVFRCPLYDDALSSYHAP